MAPRPQKADPRPAPRLTLVTPHVEDADAFAPDLAAALEGADIAAVWIRFATADERTLINRAKVLVPLVQRNGAAALLGDLPDIAARAGADGGHLTGTEAFQASLEVLKPDRIAGIGGIETRHDAMLAAEYGADYVMFGGPSDDGEPADFVAVEERIAWWAEVFELPCVGFAATHDEITALVAAGADFVALGDLIWSDARGPRMAVTAAAARLTLPEKIA